MDDESQPQRWFSFDPTFSLGHVFTAFSIIICTLSMWYGLVGDVNVLKIENAQRQKDIAEVKTDLLATNGKIDGLVQVQREEVGKLRDDMKDWFKTLDDKLDRKADKR